jgi:CCR4-NOT transcription complex subunit 7/8
MAVLRHLVLKFPYVSMDAEFPGIVARPIGGTSARFYDKVGMHPSLTSIAGFAGSKAEYHYQTLRCNVDILKPIQVGITLWSPEGELPPQHPDPELLSMLSRDRNIKHHAFNNNNIMFLPCTWVFNFHFNLDEDMYAESSIELLQKAGVDFQRHHDHGIDPAAFGSLLTTSGLAFQPEVNWLSFHSGYDFGYLIKLLTDNALPYDQHEFFEQVKTFFPRLWDIKFLLRQAQKLRNQPGRLAGADSGRIIDSLGTKSGLQDLADELGCHRIGLAHTGGSDAWLTGAVFWAMRSKIFGGNIEEDLADQIYGLHGVPAPAAQHVRDEFFAAQGTPGHQHANMNGATTFAPGQLAGQGQQQSGFTPSNLPSTPTGSHAGLHSTTTPGPSQGGNAFGQGGAFGAFAGGFGK